MSKKGFTLIELLGVILIISLLAIIVLPKITNSVNNFTPKTDKLMMNMIEDAAKLYVEDNPNDFSKENGKNYCVLISMLVNDGYLKEFNNKGIKDINSIKVTYNNGFEYELTDFYDESCTLVNYITNLYRETKTTTVNGIEYSLDETNSLMNDRLGSNSVDKTDGNIRYYGANPNNYIDIGDRDSEGNIIFWRIIGVFKDIEVTDEEGNVIKTEDLVKIIRADKLALGSTNGFSWDFTSTGTYDNNWKYSTLQALLNDEVNGYYVSGTSTYYNYSTTPTKLNFSSVGLSSEVNNKIAKVKWNLGGYSASTVYVDAMYGYERAGTDTWSGNIALMYASDYGYSTDLSSCQATLNKYSNSTCKSTNWIYDSSKSQWTLTPNSSSANFVLYVYSDGNVYSSGNVASVNKIHPVLYLKSNVSIVEEKKTSKGLKYFVVE